MEADAKATAGVTNWLGYQPALDGLRGLAVIQVVLFHARLPGFNNGQVGVGVFFVLSGFLITHLIVSEIGRSGRFSLSNFYLRRVRRLLPAYVCVVVFCVAASLVMQNWATLRGALASMVYVSNWALVFNPQKGLGMLAHTWTLSIEEQFYFLWPAILLFLSKKSMYVVNRAIITGILLLSTLSCICLILFLLPASPSKPVLLSTLGGYIMLMSGSLFALFLCQSGSLARRVLQFLRWGFAMDMLAALAICAIAVTSTIDSSHLSEDWQPTMLWMAVVPASFVLIGAAVFSRGAAHWWLTRSALVRLGTISYGLYLWHFPIFYLFDTYFGLSNIINGCFAAGASLIVASLSFNLIEAPFKKSGFDAVPFAWLKERIVSMKGGRPLAKPSDELS